MSTLARITLGRLSPNSITTISEVVGGFISAEVSEVPRASVQPSSINAGFSDVTVRATVVSTFTGRLVEPIRATVLPSPIVAELIDG